MKQNLLFIFALLCAVAQGAWAQRVVDLSFITQNYVAEYGDVLTGRLLIPVKISIDNNAHVTLRDVTILGDDDNTHNYAGITCLGNATITLEGNNEVCGFHNFYSGIQLGPKNTTLTIKGDGSLYAYSHGRFGIGPGPTNSGNVTIEGGNITAIGAEYYPGIGTDEYRAMGNITLKGGTIRAYGGESAPGIGGGWKGNCGTVTIDGSTVYAYGGKNAPGIGCQDGEYINKHDHPNKREGINIHILSGYVEAYGGDNSAGIGGGNCDNGGTITIDGGEIKAYGGTDAAGIGGGYNGHGGSISITGGTITAKGGSEGAGIGGGEDGPGGNIRISGGIITAEGGNFAAGIGGGDGKDGGTILITGGEIKAYGGTDAAGIGGGEEGNSGSITINGGNVYASGSSYGVGIGAGEDGDVSNMISINGGTVDAYGGSDIMRAIGGEDDEDYSYISIGENIRVTSISPFGNSVVMHMTRMMFLKLYLHLKFEPCDHEPRMESNTYTYFDSTRHSYHCFYCGGTVIEQHSWNSEDKCIYCDYKSIIHKVRFIEMEYDEDRKDYIYHEVSELEMDVLENRQFTMPEPIFTNLWDLVFAGWVKGKPYVENYPWMSGYEKPVQPGDNQKVEDQDLYYKARYIKREVKPSLDVSGNMTGDLEAAMGQTFNITFRGRKFIINSEWNTLCLPFSMTAEQIGDSPLANGKIVELDTEKTTLSDGVLTIAYKTATEIEAGKPYMVKWVIGEEDENTHIDDPIFKRVTISAAAPTAVSAAGITFSGTFAPLALASGDKTRLWLDDDVRLRWASGQDEQVSPTWCYWDLNGLDASTLNAIVVTFDDGSRPIVELMDGMKDFSILSAFGEQEVNASMEGRELSAVQQADGTWQSRAYTVCLPFYVELFGTGCDFTIYSKAEITENNELLFTQEMLPFLYPGNAYLIVVNEGTLRFQEEGVTLVDEAREPDDYSNSVLFNYLDEQIAGYWLGSLKTISHDEAVRRNAFTMTGDGSFQRITDGNPTWQWPAFRAMFCATNLMTADKLTTKYQLDANGVEDEEADRSLPAPASYQGDNEGEATGIAPVIHTIDLDGTERWFDINGHQLSGKPAKKGVYIHRGKKQVVK